MFPKQIERGSLLLGISPESFIKDTINGECSNLVKRMTQFQKSWQYQMDRLNRQQGNRQLGTLRRALHTRIAEGSDNS